MTVSAFEAAGINMADGVRTQFGFAATHVAGLKPGVVAALKDISGMSYGQDFDMGGPKHGL